MNEAIRYMVIGFSMMITGTLLHWILPAFYDVLSWGLILFGDLLVLSGGVMIFVWTIISENRHERGSR